jgi:hypothetical protein
MKWGTKLDEFGVRGKSPERDMTKKELQWRYEWQDAILLSESSAWSGI